MRCQSPVGPTPLRSLDISNGCQDHTTSPYAATFVIASAGHVLPSEVLKKALKRRSSCASDQSLTDLSDPPCDDQGAGAAASTASQPAFVTIATRPSVGETVSQM